MQALVDALRRFDFAPDEASADTGMLTLALPAASTPQVDRDNSGSIDADEFKQLCTLSARTRCGIAK